MTKVHQRLRDLGLSRVAGPLEQAARKSILLKASEKSKEAVSRLGGCPNLPPRMDWRVSTDGPLPFIAQLDLSALPPVREIGLPRSGGLFFFYGSSSLASNAKERELFRVLYSESPPSECRPRSFPKDLPGTSRWKGHQFETQQKAVTFPWPEDFEVVRLGLTDAELHAYGHLLTYTLKAEKPPLHSIGGYPHYIQHDPRFQAQLKSSGRWDAIWKKTANPAEYFRETNRRFAEVRRELGAEASNWEVLLQVDSDERAGMSWGDAGRLYFLIRKEELRARRFEKSWMIWDCS